MAGSAERMHHDARHHVLAIALVDIGAGAIGDTVEDPCPVGEPVLEEVSVKHCAQVAVAGHGGWQRALDEGQVAGRDQPLETERLLLFARAQFQRRPEPHVDIRVLQHRRPAAKVGHQTEVEILENRAVEDRADAAQHERIRTLCARVVQICAAVGLDEPAEAKLVRAVCRSNLEPVAARAGDGCGLRRFGLFLLIELELPLHDPDFLIELVESFRNGLIASERACRTRLGGSDARRAGGGLAGAVGCGRWIVCGFRCQRAFEGAELCGQHLDARAK